MALTVIAAVILPAFVNVKLIIPTLGVLTGTGAVLLGTMGFLNLRKDKKEGTVTRRDDVLAILGFAFGIVCAVVLFTLAILTVCGMAVGL